MSTNYGYVKQDVDSQLNWGEVGKTFNKMLTDEVDRRDSLKKEIDDNTRADLERLSKIPRGNSEEANNWLSSSSDAITKQLLMYTNALKSGKMDLKDYNTATANVRSGVNNMTDFVKNYNQWFDEGTKRAQNGDAQAAELWKNSLLESMKFKDTTPNIAYDGTMSVTKLVPSKTTALKEISENPDDSFSFSSMLDFSKTKFDRFKSDEKLNELAKVAGDYTKVYNTGHTGTISDIFQKDSKGRYINQSGVDALSTTMQSWTANPINTMSILTDSMGTNPKTGKPFEFTLDANDPRLKGPERDGIILMDKSNGLNPMLTDSQNKMAHDWLMEGLKARSGHVETAYTPEFHQPRQPSEYDQKERAKRKEEYGFLSTIDRMQTGNPDDFEASANDLIFNMNKISKKDKTNTSIGKAQRTETEFLIPVSTFNKDLNKNVTNVVRVPRLDSNGNPLAKDVVAQSLFRILTPIERPYKQVIEDFYRDEGGFSNEPVNLTYAKGGKSFTPSPKITLAGLPMISGTGKKIDAAALLTSSIDEGVEETADAAQKILSKGLNGIESNIKVVPVKTSWNKPDAIDVYIGNDVHSLNFKKGESTAALQSSIQNLINNAITKHNQRGLKEDTNKPTKTNQPVKGGFNAEDFYNKNKSK